MYFSFSNDKNCQVLILMSSVNIKGINDLRFSFYSCSRLIRPKTQPKYLPTCISQMEVLMRCQLSCWPKMWWHYGIIEIFIKLFSKPAITGSENGKVSFQTTAFIAIQLLQIVMDPYNLVNIHIWIYIISILTLFFYSLPYCYLL